MTATTTTWTKLLDVLFEDSLVGRCLVAPDGTILRANSEWLRSTGLTPEVFGEDIIALFPQVRDMAVALHARARAGHRVEVSRHALVVNGRETWREGHIDPVPMEGGTGLLITARELPGAARGLTAEQTPSPSAERLVEHLDAMTRLHRLSTRVVRAEDLAHVLGETVEAAIAITHADMGNLQLLDPASSTLKIAAHRGHERWWLDFFDSVAAGEGASCGMALRRGTRVIIEDVAESPVFVGTPALEVQLRAGVRAVQSTPLVGSSGDLVGMISTHYRTSRRPDERDLQLLDVLARQTVDTIERVRSEETLRQSEERLRALADSMPQLAWTAQPDGSIDWFNRRCYEYTGASLEQLQGWGWQSVHHPATLPEVLRGWRRCIATGTSFEMELPLRRADGTFRRFLTRVFPLKRQDGSVLQWFGTHTDVTEMVEAREALREADRRKDEFLGMLSHELRNPLAPIRNSLYLLDRAEPTGQEAHRARDVINRQVGHLTRLVDDLLDVTRITRGKVELRRLELDLAVLVRRTADDYRRMMQDRGLELAVELGDEALVVHGDETRLAQVFGNLLSNAAKFTPNGGRVTIAARAEDGRAAVRVRDTGPGIAPEVLSSIFEPFTQGKQTLARTEGGLGLGLALVRGLVSLHGGEVNVVSGTGAEFIVRLPLAVRQERQAAPPRVLARAATHVSHHRVLVVDDNEDAAETLAELVRMLGHDVELAYDGPTAVRRAAEYHPDVVLCDIGLPGMDGYEVAHELRTARGRDVRLVAISGYAQPEDVTRAAQAGFDEHLAKPCGPEQIERLLS
jgi:PAS domain S-box-containing protein